MAGTLIVSNLKTDTDNTFIVRSNTGTTLFSANTTGIDIANSIGATAITNDKILSVANTKITGNIISSQIAPSVTLYGNPIVTGNLTLDSTATSKLYLSAANTVAIQTANTTALTISSAQIVNFANAPTVASAPFTASQWTTTGSNIYYSTGNVGIGSAPSAWSGFTALDIGSQSSLWSIGSGNGTSYYSNNLYYNGSARIYKTTGGASEYTQSTGSHQWYYAGSGTAGNSVSLTEVMRTTSSGQFIVGATSTSAIQSGSAGFYATKNNDCGFGTNGTSALGAVSFYNSNGGVGSIQTSGSSTIYNTGSDYRLKENIQPMTNALAKVAQLKPCTYKWKFDGTDGEGFIAHELAEVFPIAVSGQKDEMQTYTDDDGNEQTKPKWQGVDASFLIGALTGAIQELKAINDTQAATITALTARIVALEGQ